MKRHLPLLFMLLLALLASPAGAAPPGDSAVGSNKVTQPNGDFQHINVSAHSGPAGENPRGNVEIKYRSAFFPGGEAHGKGRVTCLNVISATQALVAAELREPIEGNTHVTLIISDNGGPVMGVSPDQVFFGLTSSPPEECAESGSTLIGDSSGNVIVRDGS